MVKDGFGLRAIDLCIPYTICLFVSGEDSPMIRLSAEKEKIYSSNPFGS